MWLFLNSWLTSGLSFVTPKISLKLSIHVTLVAYVAPAAIMFTGYWLLIREKAYARNLTLWRQEQKAINIQSQIINSICKKILFSEIET